MISNFYSKLLVLLALENALGIQTSDLYDIHQIRKYKGNLTVELLFDHYWRNMPNNIDEQNEGLKACMHSLTDKLDQLNLIASDEEDNYWSNDFYRFIKTVEEHQIKIGYGGSFFDLEKFIRLIERKRDAIDSAVRSVLYFRSYDYFNNLINMCPYLLGFFQFVEFGHYEKSIASVYQDFLRSLMTKLATEDQHNFCGKASSFRVGLFNFYRLAMTPFLKKYVLVDFAKVIELHCQNRTSFFPSHDELLENFFSALQLTKKLLHDVSHYTYRCDIKYITQYNKNFVYYELEKMIQTIIVEERAISNVDSCNINCALPNDDGLINHSECLAFQNCRYITSSYEFCPSKNTSSRRYEWFKDKNGVVYGHSNYGNCVNKIKSVESYFHAGKLRECDYCVCTCVTNPFSKNSRVALISFREQVSDIEDNMVVTGVRFMEKNNMMHVQIKQGKMHPNGLISNSGWKGVEIIRKHDKTNNFYVDVNETHAEPLISGIDYGFPNGINFDEVHAPEGFVVTGVGFQPAGNLINDVKLGIDSVGLKLRMTRFNFIQGTFSYSESYWTSIDEETREEFIMTDPDTPTRSPKNSIISKKNRFIKFGPSDMKKDAGQSTIPFFDAQKVEGYPEFPLGGVGLILRGREGYGGFLAFRIFDLHLHQYLKSEDSL